VCVPRVRFIIILLLVVAFLIN